MKEITDEIQRALEAKLFYLALIVTMSLPDICAALETPDGTTTPELYRAWCRDWLPHTTGVTPEEMYRLRCALSHQGRARHYALPYKRVLFSLPSEDGHVFHNNESRGEFLNVDLRTFCSLVIDAVECWFKTHRMDTNVRRNLESLIQYRTGVLPLGIRVIA